MSNVAGKAYAMNTFIFIAARALPDKLTGLLGLSIIHFARWVMVRRDQWPDLDQGKEQLGNDYMLSCSGQRNVKCRCGSAWRSWHLPNCTAARGPSSSKCTGACAAAGFNSPFARCSRTHVVRAALISQPIFNGRDGGDAMLQGVRSVNLLSHQSVDRL